MDKTQYVKGSCQKCKEHLEFPAEGLWETVKCPHCGKKTKLIADSESWAKLKMWELHGTCDLCGATYDYEGPVWRESFPCGHCKIEMQLKPGRLSKSPESERSSPCPRCRKSVLDTLSICPHCSASLTPIACPQCGCSDFQVTTPSKPILFTPLSLAGALVSAAASAASSAIFRDEYRCARCGHRCA